MKAERDATPVKDDLMMTVWRQFVALPHMVATRLKHEAAAPEADQSFRP